ncbi:MAG: hypothetical protein HC916_17105 [Coleofasciculaceae cyanobacterium SM2_1_6]|nr:hypothetical protein [Coleofasciculaceae cyanobacterium SM2_1_6]
MTNLFTYIIPSVYHSLTRAIAVTKPSLLWLIVKIGTSSYGYSRNSHGGFRFYGE